MKRYHAAEKRIAELERKEQHSERQSVIDALAGSGEEWSDIEEYMQVGRGTLPPQPVKESEHEIRNTGIRRY
jgi:hypothetical protein